MDAICAIRNITDRNLTKISIAVLAATVMLSVAGVDAQEKAAPVPIANLIPSERTQIEVQLKTELERAIARQKRIPGQGQHVSIISVSLEPVTNQIVLNLSASFLPRDTSYRNGERSMGPAFESLLQELDNVSYTVLQNKYEYTGTTVLVEGRDLYEYFTDDRVRRDEGLRTQKEEEKRRKVRADSRKSTTAFDNLVVVNPGHGLTYYYSGAGQWNYQRPKPSEHPEVNGIQEDLTTQELAAIMAYAFSGRQNTTEVRSTRSFNKDVIHASSGHPWYDISSRYVLQLFFPQRTDMWNTHAGSTAPDREEKDDIDARGAYAKEIGADAMISIHTNAAGATATGTRAFYTPGWANSTESQKMATSILCGMKEVIHAKDAYKNFSVPNAPDTGGYGENTRAGTVPAAIVEVAFHTNPSDAAALKDFNFRNAAMLGIEKGYRIYKQGKVCEPFSITSIPDATGQRGTTTPVPVSYKGFPEFPVKLKLRNISCPSGSTCKDIETSYTTQTPSPLKYMFACTGTSTQTAVSRWSVTLTDVDGVITNAKEFSFTCTPNALTKSLIDDTLIGADHAR